MSVSEKQDAFSSVEPVSSVEPASEKQGPAPAKADAQQTKRSQNEVLFSTREAVLEEAAQDEDDNNLDNSVNVRLANPLLGLSPEQIQSNVHEFVNTHDLAEWEHLFYKGALCAQAQATGSYDSIKELTPDERTALSEEKTHRWKQPFMLYWLAVCCSVAAAIQGADETVINGANLYMPKQFGIGSDDSRRDKWLKGLVASGPYIACAFLGSWLTEPLNYFLGRRGTICLTAFISFASCIWQGVTNSWQHLFVARLVLGLGIGPKSATVPMYAAECSPPLIRGALAMQWQTWTAFGMMLGYAADLVLFRVGDPKGGNGNIHGLNWRLMLGSASLPALFVMLQVYLCPESPRWLMKKNKYHKAMESFLKLRPHELLAARDLYFAHCLIEEERRVKESKGNQWTFLELFTIPRNLRATIAGTIVMFGQQFCGVNVIAYFSSSIISDALSHGRKNLSPAETVDINRKSLLGSWGFGMLNFLFAIPAWYTIDTFGRRNLLLVTLPFMCIFLLMTGFAFFIPMSNSDARLGVVLTGIYLYVTQYSPGFGPVPFTYCAEAFPIYVREIGMAYCTAVLWFFNSILSVTWFAMEEAFTSQGAFGWYAAWCIILWVLVLLFLPETKALTLEELDIVFSVPTVKHAAYQVRLLIYKFRKYVLRQKNVQHQHLYSLDKSLAGKN